MFGKRSIKEGSEIEYIGGEVIMLKTVSLIMIGIITSFLGCSETETDQNSTNDINNNYPQFKLGEQFDLKFGQTITIDPDNIKVKFIDVTEDSRCPSDVVCIWAGQVSVLINVKNNGNDVGDVKLTLGQNKEDTVKNIDGYYLKLIEVKPYPISTKKIEKSDYIITLIVSKSI